MLLFDRLACPGLEWALPHEELGIPIDNRSPLFKQQSAEVRWLIDRGLLFSPAKRENRLIHALRPRAQRQLRRLYERVLEKQQSVLERPHFFRSTADFSKRVTFRLEFPLVPRFVDISDEYSRMLAIELREIHHLNAIPIVNSWRPGIVDTVTRTEVIEVVLREPPIPGDNHSFEDILAFRDEAKELRLDLRVWINEMASGKLTQFGVADKLAHLVSRFDRALKLEKCNEPTE